MPHIYLTGFMGSGKSSVGKLLAERLDLPYLDCDALIEEEAGKTIAQIFAEEGESAFRDQETRLLERLPDHPPAVISTGGGMPKRAENRALMRKAGVIVHLEAAPEVIYERVKGETHRPLLQVNDPLSKIRELLVERAEAYNDCDLSLSTDAYSIQTIVDLLIERLTKMGFKP